MSISPSRTIELPRRSGGFLFAWLVAGVLFAQQAGAWPDLKIVKSGPAQAGPGDIITYTLNYTNNGPVKSTLIVMKDFLPPNVTALTNTLNGGTLSGSTITWNIGTLNSKARGSKTFQVQIGTNFPIGESYITNRSEIFGKEAEEPGDSADNTSKFVTKVVNKNKPPIAQSDAYSTPEDTLLSVSAPGVLANDSDPDGNSLSAVLVSNPTNGVLTLSANGGFTYIPATNFNGLDYFTYRANDGKTNSGVAVVCVTVLPVNDRPVARNDQYSIIEDTVLTIAPPGVLTNDTDADGDTLTATIASQPTNGQVTLNANGGFIYTPNTNFNGTDSFTYRATDGKTNSGTATVTIIVTPLNDPPVARNDQYSIIEDTVLTIAPPGVLTNDTDADNDALTATIASQPTNGQVTLNANGGFTYTPNTNFNGTDSFTYRANDGKTNSGTATVTIIVTPLNDPPVARNDQYSTPEDTVLTIAAPGVLTNDTDTDGDLLTAIIAAQSSNGQVALSTNGSFVYTPNTNFSGTDSFTYRANDGKTNSGTATVTITVTPVNDPPMARNDQYTMVEDTVLTIAPPGVLTNDTDADADALTAMIATQPGNGQVTLNPDGGFIYTPNTNFSGADSFTYRANDGKTNSGTATVTIIVTPLNDPPVARNDQYSTPEDTVLTIAAPGVLTNDTDADGDLLTAIIAAQPSNGQVALSTNGSFVYTPNTDFNGTDSFTYRANDGLTSSELATVTISVVGTDDAPVALNDQYSTGEDMTLTVTAPGVLDNDIDVDGDLLVATLVGSPSQGTLLLSTNGSFTYAPNTNFTGVDTFTYRANDGKTNSNLATVTITVTPTNDAPIALNDAYSVGEDSVLVIAAPGVLANDSDPEGDALTVSLASNPTFGTLLLSANGSFSYSPNTNFTGVDSFTYRASDGAATSQVATVTITVTPTNDAPIALNDQYATAEDTVLMIAGPGVLANDSDLDGDALTAILTSGPTNGVLTLNANGSFSYAPNTNFFGMDAFTYRANDGQLDSSTATVTITVTPVFDPPNTNNWSGKSFTLLEDTVLSVLPPGVLRDIFDVDGRVLRALLVRAITNGTFSLQSDGSFNLTPFADFNGRDAFEFAVADDNSNSVVLSVDITVLPVNDPPSFIKGGNFRLPQNAGPQVITNWATAISPGPANESTQTVAFIVANDRPALFTVQPAISPAGTLTFTPAPGASGSANVTVFARDNGGTADGGMDTSAEQTFVISLNAPPTVQIVSPTNGAFFFVPGAFTVLAEAQDLDGTITNVQFFLGTNAIAVSTNEPFFTVLTNLPAGSYTLGARAFDDLGATGDAAPVTVSVLERPPLTYLTSVYYNPQKDFFEQRVRVSNPTYSLLNAVRVLVSNLTNSPAITVGNRSGFTNGIPYVQTAGVIEPGSFVDLTIEYHSPLRIMPNPVLRAELVPPAELPPLALGTMQRFNRSLLLANRTFMLEFRTITNRVYSVQYSTNLVNWKAAQPAIAGDGNWIQWIDNGEPKTDRAPASVPARFYRLILLP